MTASVKPLLAFKRRKLSSLQQKLPNFSHGEQGERTAQTFLTSQGYVVLATNLGYGRGQSYNWGEADIIALDTCTQDIAFIEVKTRHSAAYGEPSLSVGYTKRRALIKVAQAFLEERGLENDYRFDIICVLPTQIQHFKNITW